jgi:hypothetical protein
LVAVRAAMVGWANVRDDARLGVTVLAGCLDGKEDIVDQLEAGVLPRGDELVQRAGLAHDGRH